MAAASGSGGGIKELHEKLAPSARAVVEGSSVARCGKAACAGGTEPRPRAWALGEIEHRLLGGSMPA